MEIVLLADRYKVHHFKGLEAHFAGRFLYEPSYDFDKVMSHRPELVICFDEHWGELGSVIGSVREANVATLQVMDGILEWRRTWDYEWEGHRIDGVINPINQPVLAHKIACLGRRDTRLMESWGNLGKCEVVGAPRMDGLADKRLSGGISPRLSPGRKPRLLVMTAKTYGFTEAQRVITRRSLTDLKACFEGRPDIDVIWRVTRGLDEELGVKNTLSDLAGGEFHTLLDQVDGVITTPSTSMLEAMVMDRPVALLDYHNCPHYFESVWSIYCADHIPQVIGELLNPPKPKYDYQNFLLAEQLAFQPTATGRLIRLIEEMLKVRKAAGGGPLEFPARILGDEKLFFTPTLPLSRLKEYYPHLPLPDDLNIRELQTRLTAALGAVVLQREKVAFLEKRLKWIPGYRLAQKVRGWLRK